jgi:hypothetical protein
MDNRYRNAGGKRHSSEPAVIVQDVEGLAVPGRLIKDIENAGDVVALVQRLPYPIWMAFGQYLVDCR